MSRRESGLRPLPCTHPQILEGFSPLDDCATLQDRDSGVSWKVIGRAVLERRGCSARKTSTMSTEGLFSDLEFRFESGGLVSAFGDIVRARMEPCYLDLGDGTEVVRFVGLGETWMRAPNGLVEMLYQESPVYRIRAEDFGMDFDEICLRLEWLGTEQALAFRGALAKQVIASLAADMSNRFGGTYISFETDNPGIPWFNQQPRHLEATSSLVGVAEVVRSPSIAVASADHCHGLHSHSLPLKV